MNLAAVRALKAGEKIKFNAPCPLFTDGKEYEVIETIVGKMVHDDYGGRRFLWNEQIRLHFNR